MSGIDGIATIFFIWVMVASSAGNHHLHFFIPFLDFEAKKRIAFESLQTPLARHCCLALLPRGAPVTVAVIIMADHRVAIHTGKLDILWRARI